MASKNRTKSGTDRLKLRTDCKWTELKEELWFEQPEDVPKLDHQTEMRLRKEAQELFDTECYKYVQFGQDSNSKRTDFNWIRIVLKKGALADKLAAHTLLIQDSALHNLRSVEELVKMVHSKGKREQLMAMDHLKDIFLATLLSTKKLRGFADLLAGLTDQTKHREQLLMIALYEDNLRQQYRNYVEGVEKITHDVLPSTKSKAINTLAELLASNPEQERYLLEKLVNKLGDPSGKVASHVAHSLKQLTTESHPAMKTVVVTEVERLLYRPNIKDKAQYYALCFLQELIFRPADYQLANRLVQLYFGFFSTAIKKGEVDNKMMNALLTAVSRALPYSNLAQTVLEQHMETFYKLIHLVSTNLVIQGLMLMHNVLQGTASSLSGSDHLTDRFYQVLFRVILDDKLEHCSKVAMFLNLLFRCIKADKSLKRVLAFLKRLLQLSKDSGPQFSAAILIIMSEICRLRPEVAAAFYKQTKQEIDLKKFNQMQKFQSKKMKQVAKNRAAAEKAKFEKDPNEPDPENEDKDDPKNDEYNPQARNPLYANADKVQNWELHQLTKHFHPTVALFAQNVQTRKMISYDGDPLADFTLKHFLERFVFRNPKHVTEDDSGHARQASVFGRVNRQGRQDLPFDPKMIGQMADKKIPIEERFIYKYLSDKQQQKGFDENQDDEDIESVASDEFEQLLDRFENDVDGLDLEGDYKRGRKKKKAKEQDQDEDGSDADSDMSFVGDDSDDEINFDDDEDYQNAFRDLYDDDDEEPNKADRRRKGPTGSDSDESEEEHLFDDDPEDIGRHHRRGRSKTTSSLFASADEFAALLEGRGGQEDMGDSDDPFDSDDGEGFPLDDPEPSKSAIKKRKRSQQPDVERKFTGAKQKRLSQRGNRFSRKVKK